MELKDNMIIDIYSIALLSIIFLHSYKNNEKRSVQSKIYNGILLLTLLMLVVDIFSRFDGFAGSFYPVMNHIGNFLIFLLNPVLPSLWLLYVYIQVFGDEDGIKSLLYPLIAVNAANAIMLVLTQFFGWFYTIDPNNIYRRGPLFLFSASITILLMLAGCILVLSNRRRIEKKHYFALCFFAVPPFAGIILQILFYGVSIVLNSVVLSILIVFLNIQNQSIHTDYLTGVNNRKKLELYLEKKISASTVNKSFSAVMIDYNNFKAVNDTYGHDMGDKALQISVKLISNCLRSNDFIARFGGDEFCIVLDVSNMIDLEEIVSRIKNCIELFNQSGLRPFKLDFSMGYAVYDSLSHMTSKDFLRLIDRSMYENKQGSRVAKSLQNDPTS